MSDADSALPAWPTGPLQRGAVLLVVLTGAIHLSVGVDRAQPSLAVAGLGFFGAIALFLAGYRRPLYMAGIPYVLGQIVLWLVFQAGEYTIVGVIDKTVQVALVLALVVLYRSNEGE